MQSLFYMDMAEDFSEEALRQFCGCFAKKIKLNPFFFKLVKGVIRFRPTIDPLINQFSTNWKIHRMSCVDRNILRIAIYEMVYCEDIPEKVSINEAIDVGKKFGTRESGAFINGILDSVRKAMEDKVIKIDSLQN